MDSEASDTNLAVMTNEWAVGITGVRLPSASVRGDLNAEVVHFLTERGAADAELPGCRGQASAMSLQGCPDKGCFNFGDCTGVNVALSSGIADKALGQCRHGIRRWC